MFEVLFFLPEGHAPADPTALAETLTAAGVALDGDELDRYRPGRWRHAATSAQALVDLGEPPLERDDQHRPRAYAGWRPAPLAIRIPLAGPHWQAVEALALVEAVLAAHPGLRALDSEDVIEAEGIAPGPFPWNRPRAIASWEAQHASRCTGLDLPVLARPHSVRVWRYRRERPAARAAHPDLHWPDALVLRDGATGQARSACLWTAADEAFALPPVELVVLRQGGRGGVIGADEVLAAVGNPTPLAALACPIRPSAALHALFNGSRPLPAAGFSALLDEDWRD